MLGMTKSVHCLGERTGVSVGPVRVCLGCGGLGLAPQASQPRVAAVRFRAATRLAAPLPFVVSDDVSQVPVDKISF